MLVKIRRLCIPFLISYANMHSLLLFRCGQDMVLLSCEGTLLLLSPEKLQQTQFAGLCADRRRETHKCTAYAGCSAPQCGWYAADADTVPWTSHWCLASRPDRMTRGLPLHVY